MQLNDYRRRILITGGAGFVGYHLATYLLQDPCNELVLVDSFTRGRRDEDFGRLLQNPHARLIEADLTEPGIYGELGDGYDEVYHLAAKLGVKNVMDHPDQVIRVNVLATLLLLDWFVSGSNKKLVFSSTSEVYAWTAQFYSLPVPTPEDVPLALSDLHHPRASYAGSKMLGELAVHQYCQQNQKEYSIVRYHNVYGPRMGYEHVIPQLYLRVLDGQNPLEVFSPDHVRAFCYISDAVDATVRAMRYPAANGQTINIGNDREELEMEDLARRIVALSGKEVAITPKENPHDPIRRRCPNIHQARRLLEYEPKTSLNEGLEQTLTWYARHPNK